MIAQRPNRRPNATGAIRSFVLLVAVSASMSSVNAAVLRLPNTPYNYTVVDQDLPAALNEFGSNLNIKVNVSPEVRGRIQGKLQEPTARAFLDRISALYNLEWYYDGTILYISNASENKTQLLVLNPIGYDHLKRSLDALGISDPRYPIRAAPGDGVILNSGPPRYVQLVEQTLAGLVAEEDARRAHGRGARELFVYRGSSATVLRDGRPERIAGQDAPPAPLPQTAPTPGTPAPGSNDQKTQPQRR